MYIVLGVAVGFVLGSWLLPRISDLIIEARRNHLRQILAGDDSPERNECLRWLHEGDISGLQFAESLLSCGSPRVEFSLAKVFVAIARPTPECALEALARVAQGGSEAQRREAISLLQSAPNRCQSIVAPLIRRLVDEQCATVRRDMLSLLEDMARQDSADRLQSWVRSEIVKAMAQSLEDPASDVREFAFMSLCQLLSFAVKDAEWELMRLLRSKEQSVADLAALISLCPSNREKLKAAVSCIPTSRASRELVNRVLKFN